MSNKISVINNYLLLTNNNYLTDCCLCGGNVFGKHRLAII
jgi:hypothetical protein